MTSGPQYSHMPRPLYSSAILTVLLIFWFDFLRKIFVHSFHFVLSLSFCGTFFVDEDPFSHYPGWPSAPSAPSASSLLSFSFFKSTLCWIQEILDNIPSIVLCQHTCFDVFDLAVSRVKNLILRPVVSPGGCHLSGPHPLLKAFYNHYLHTAAIDGFGTHIHYRNG